MRMNTYSLSVAKISETPKGTRRYWAPELSNEDVIQSEKTDIWAYGMTVSVLLVKGLLNSSSLLVGLESFGSLSCVLNPTLGENIEDPPTWEGD